MNYKLKRTLFSLALVCLSLPLTVAAQTPGTLDTTFGGGGKVITESPAFLPMSEARGVAVQSDGKIVVTGYAGSNNSADFLTVRYNADGSLDTGFGAAGRVITNLSSFDNANAVAIQPDGKIVIAGRTVVNSSFVFAVVRYNANGTLDTSFGTGGSVTTDFNVYNEVNSIALQPDGKIIAFGEASQQQGNLTGSFLMVRYNTNGSLDSTFGTGGKVGTAFGINGARGYDVALQPDGKIVGFGITRQSSPSFQGIFGVVRYNSNGTLDTSFNGTGRATILFENNEAQFGKIALQPDGKIVMGGGVRSNLVNESNVSRVAVARLLPNGALDTSFDLDGKVTTRIGATINGVAYDGLGEDVAVQTNGKILVGGYTQVSIQGLYDFALVRYNSDGSIDTGFGTNGLTTTSFGSGFNGGDDRAHAMALQSNGKIVLAGASSANPANQLWFAVARYNGDPVTTTTSRTLFDFDGDGKADISVFRPSNSAWYLQQSTAGFTGVQFGVSTDKIVPADYDGDGKTDVTVFRSGVWYLQRSQLGFTGVAFGASDDIPVPADYDGDGKADIAVFRPSNSTWYLLQSTAGFTGVQFGQAGDKLVPADYDGDGKTDIAVFRVGVWYVQRSTLGFTGFQFGSTFDVPVVGDYDGDGKADAAVYRNGTWYVLRSTIGFLGFQFGNITDLPVPADYDGDGKTDFAVFRSGTWYLQQSTAGFTGLAFGASTDSPVPNAFIP